MALNQYETYPVWKVHEGGDLRSELMGLFDVAPDLVAAALAAWTEGYPATIVSWCARRCWAQGRPDQFRMFLTNHALDTKERLEALDI